MDKDHLKSWLKAGSIASEARDFGKTLLVPNANVFDISSKIEDFILKNGGKPGFPVQISINDIAAHYTPFPNDNLTIKEGDLIKLDLGVHIDGFIGDTALTVEVKSSNNTDLLKSSKDALDAAIKLCKPGTQIWEIGEAVENIITNYGFQPIRNLSGHKVSRYELHSDLSIPSFNNKDKTELWEDLVIAIEPFSSTGVGLVKEGKPSSNYRWPGESKMPRDSNARDVLKFIKDEFNTLPFAKRYLINKFPLPKINLALMNLLREEILYEYPQLPEKSGGLVSQHEHTILIKDKPMIITKHD